MTLFYLNVLQTFIKDTRSPSGAENFLWICSASSLLLFPPGVWTIKILYSGGGNIDKNGEKWTLNEKENVKKNLGQLAKKDIAMSA